MLVFNEPVYLEKGMDYISEAIIKNKCLNGDGAFTKKCTDWFEKRLQTKVLLTTSCTHALEMSALLSELREGDEVILPSFTFVSTASAFALRGAKLRYIDIRQDTMNMDEEQIENAITEKTRAIVPVHYAGVACEMDRIMDIARRHSLLVIEDACKECGIGTIMGYYGGVQRKAFGNHRGFRRIQLP